MLLYVNELTSATDLKYKSKMDEPTIDVGWVGLGNAGYPMAACLAKKGYRLLVRDAAPARGIEFVEEYPKCRVATSDPDSFQNCRLVVTMLPNGKVVNDVLLGAQGIAPHLKPGSIVVDTSSSSPFDTRALGLELSRLRVHLVDSPITQEQLHAIDRGGATLMVGADSPEALETAMPVLKDMSTHVFPMGALGAGHTMKTLNNYVSVGSIIALNDALVRVLDNTPILTALLDVFDPSLVPESSMHSSTNVCSLRD